MVVRMNDCRSSNVIPVQDSLSQTLFLSKTVYLKRYSCPRQFVSNVIPVEDSLSPTLFLYNTVCLKRHSCPRQFVLNVIPVQDSLKRYTCPRQFVSNIILVQHSLSQNVFVSDVLFFRQFFFLYLISPYSL